MNKILICYFSASGVTRRVAEKLANLKQANLFEIEPVEKYTETDLDWTNKTSRSSIEMQDKSFRPAVKNKVSNLNDYDTIILGFPVWWYTAPTIINTFIEENNLIGKDIYIFVTSGSSSFGGSLKDLRETYPNLNFISGVRFTPSTSDNEILTWLS